MTSRLDGKGAAVADERAEQILVAACRAIARLGFGSTRIADVAREAGTSTGTVHYYFETKDDLLVAALRWANTRPYDRLDEMLDPGDDATTKLAKLIEFSVPYPGRGRDGWVLWLEFWNRALLRPELLEESEQVELRWRAYFFRIVDEGAESGEFKPVAPADEVAERLIALVNGLGIAAVAERAAIGPERFRELAFRFISEQLAVPIEELAARAAAVSAEAKSSM